MAASELHNIASGASTLVASQGADSLPDQDLLGRFLAHKDEGAFAALMERHGAMVLGVCNRVLRSRPDAEDACQAVFLVLARKAALVRKRGSLGSWLHGVAWRVACKLQAQLARRRVREDALAGERPTEIEPADVSLREACRILDEELQRLPQHYRAPLVLCHLEGRTQDEAARELGWTQGMVRGRLERGRERLRLRLIRRGVTGAALLAVTALGATPSSAAVPAMLVVGTVKVSLAMTAAKGIPATLSPTVAALTQQTLHGMFLVKLQLAALACMSVAALGLIAWTTTLSVITEEDTPAAETAKLEVWSRSRFLESPKEHMWCVAFSPDGKWIAAGSGGVLPTAGVLRLWEARTGKLLYAVPSLRSVRCVAFAPDGKTLATAEHDGVARLRDAETGQVVRTLIGHRSNIDVVAFAADSKSLATSSWDGTVKLWRTATGKEIRTLGGYPRQIFCVACSSDGVVASASVDGVIRTWQASTGKAQFILRGHQDAVHWLAFSPDGKTLASASWDRTVKLWDMAGGKLLATLEGHPEPVLAVAFSPDGKTLASTSGSWGSNKILKAGPTTGDLILWNLATQQPRVHIRLDDRVMGAAFTPDGTTVAAASWDGSVSLWSAEKKPAGKTATPPAPQAAKAEPVVKSIEENNGELRVIRAPEPAVNAAEPAPTRTYAADFQQSLKGEAPQGLSIYGPDAAQNVRFEPDGLRITLPAGYPRARPGTGAITDFGIRGDFEITMSFEILSKPETAPPMKAIFKQTGKGQKALVAWTPQGFGRHKATLSLVVVPHEPPRPDVWHKANQNRASLAREALGSETQFATITTRWNEASVKDKWGNEVFTNKERRTINEFPTEAASGRLLLVRSGSVLFFYASEGSGVFKLLHKADFGTRELKNVRVLGSTDGPGSFFDVRITDLHIRADGLPRILATAVEQAGTTWWLVIAGAVLGVIAVSLGSLVYLRRRWRGTSLEEQTLVSPHGTEQGAGIAFLCPGCGKRLKARAALAGKNVKCPGCGKAVAVPASTENTGGLS